MYLAACSIENTSTSVVSRFGYKELSVKINTFSRPNQLSLSPNVYLYNNFLYGKCFFKVPQTLLYIILLSMTFCFFFKRISHKFRSLTLHTCYCACKCIFKRILQNKESDL